MSGAGVGATVGDCVGDWDGDRVTAPVHARAAHSREMASTSSICRRVAFVSSAAHAVGKLRVCVARRPKAGRTANRFGSPDTNVRPGIIHRFAPAPPGHGGRGAVAAARGPRGPGSLRVRESGQAVGEARPHARAQLNADMLQ